MEQLDLHGIRHHQAKIIVEDFILKVDMPARIVTGHSIRMQEIVREVVKKNLLFCDYESHVNLGAFVITEIDNS
mgnify:CR=1 FL=1